MRILFATDGSSGAGQALQLLASSLEPDRTTVVSGLMQDDVKAALAAVAHGVLTRIRRLEPDAVLVLATYVFLLGALWRASV